MERQRDIVFCHQCENEWYRDEGGLTCPECQSDFTEIVEGNNDPRAQEADDTAPAAATGSHPLHEHDPWNAPDPDEDDIDHFQWQQGPSYRATFNRTYNLDGRGQVQGQAPGAGGGLLGMIGNMVGGLLQQQNQQQQPQRQEHGHEHEHGQEQGQGGQHTTRSAPGSPTPGQQQPEGRPGVYTRHIHGPGYSFTMTATSGGNLSPRNANTAQPFNGQPQDMDDLMQQMFNNIGGFPPLMPGQDPHQNENEQPRGPGGNPVFPATLFQLLNNLAPPGGVHGDAVYSQEALDRIVSQLMEQHQTGNAPGPASEAAIRSLPTRPITKEDGGDSGSADCSICMDEVPVGDSVTVLPCSHWFHHDCIRAWLGEHDTCPVCRKGIMPREPDAQGEGARTSNQAPLNDHSTAAAAASTTPSGNNSSAGVFNRMRDAFGSGSRGSDSGNAGGTGGSST